MLDQSKDRVHPPRVHNTVQFVAKIEMVLKSALMGVFSLCQKLYNTASIIDYRGALGTKPPQLLGSRQTS